MRSYDQDGNTKIADTSQQYRVIYVIARKDVSLKFADHINSITAKALRRVGLLFKCFITRDHNILVKAFNTYVPPVLEYASSIWSPTQIG